MMNLHSPPKGAKVETLDLGSSIGKVSYDETDNGGATRHARADSKNSSNGLSRNKSTRKSEPRFPSLPIGASPRILCLDGGGIRGIVQLELLRGIEHALGDHIPAPAFFDLIVGTGTGGLIAMTLSMRGQTVNTCTDQFKTICDRAFKPKVKAAAPLVRSISAKLGSGRRYQSKSLYDVLRTTFGENNNLLESQRYFTQGSRVAVTSTNATEQEPFLLGNYPKPESLDNRVEQDKDLKVWQSVAAAISDPAYFPPFEHDARTYLDGGLKCSNPAAIADKERRLLWPEVEDPDLFLSLGTGQHRLDVLQKLSKQRSGSPDGMATSPPPVKTRRASARMSRRWSMRKDEETIDTERSWTEFKNNITRDGHESKGRRFLRLNPDLGKTPPAPDNKQEIEALQDNVRKGLHHGPKALALRNIAHRLVASSFYLDSRSTVTDEMGERIFSGTLACRFKFGSDQLKALGRILQDRSVGGFEPYVLIKPDAHSKYQTKKISFTQSIVRVMIERGIFALPGVSIPLQDESLESTLNLFLEPADELEPDGFPISGFPDVLDNQLTRQQSKQKAPPRRPRAFSDQMHSSGASPTLGFLSRSNTVSGATSKLNKRATFSHPSTKPTAPGVSLQEIITEEQESGAFVERGSSQFWSYIGNKNMEQNPELYSPEEIAQFTTPSSKHFRSSSIATDYESQMQDPFADDMWSPLEWRPSVMSLRSPPG